MNFTASSYSLLPQSNIEDAIGYIDKLHKKNRRNKMWGRKKAMHYRRAGEGRKKIKST